MMMTTKKKPPHQVVSTKKLRLLETARKREITISEADQKPPASKHLHPTVLPHSIASCCYPFAIPAGPPPVNNNNQHQSWNEVLDFDPEEVQRQREILQAIQHRNNHASSYTTRREMGQVV
jgi:hypothetical protein